MTVSTREKWLSRLLQFFYLILLAGIVFSWRAITSIGLGLILLTGLVFLRSSTSHRANTKGIILLIFSCLLLFSLTCLSLFYTKDWNQGLVEVQRKSGIVLIPLALWASQEFLTRKRFIVLMNYFTLFILLACFICLAVALRTYLARGISSVFFYHELVSPFGQHAIQFSLLVFFDLLFLIESLENGWLLPRPFLVGIILLLSLMMVLLSSKLVLLFYLLWLVYYFFVRKRIKLKRALPFLALILACGIPVVFTSNPFSQRFRLLFNGNQELFRQDSFNRGTYFNGIQFRLLQWRLTGEILSEQNAWFAGVSPGDAQTLLNHKYDQKNMYTGEPGQPKTGYWNYHTHNQFLQTLLQNGISGLVALLLFWLALALCIMEDHQFFTRSFVFMLFLYCFSDAPLETQYGMILLIFLPFFSYLSHRFRKELHPESKVLATK